MKEPGKILIPIGWVLIVLSVMALVGIILGPHHKDPSIETFMNHPDSLSLAGTIGFLVGSNALSLIALGFGIYAVARKNRKGKPLIVTSIIAVLIMSVIQLVLPSSKSANSNQRSFFVTTIPPSEFEVTFPHPVERKIVTLEGIETITYESFGPSANPYLRAEFINNIDTVYMGSNLRNVLENHTRLVGLNLPEITESNDYLGRTGTYSGIKKIGDLTVKFYGKMVIGESSVINCMVCENLEDFPSEDTIRFLSSLKRK